MTEIRPEDYHQGAGELYAWMGFAEAQKGTILPQIENNYGNAPLAVPKEYVSVRSSSGFNQKLYHNTSKGASTKQQSTVLQSNVA